MSKSLNHYASRIAYAVGQPNNQALKELAKDLIKDYYAKYIIQSIDRNGISNNYKASLELNVTPIEASAIINEFYNIWGYVDEYGVWVRDNIDQWYYKEDGITPDYYYDAEFDRIYPCVKHPKYKVYTEYKTITKVPVPMNIKNDAPFTKVGVIGTAKTYTYCSEISYRISTHPSPTRSPKLYQYKDNYISVRHISPITDTIIVAPITRIEVEGIWESPEEVIGFYGNTDNQDLELPFPNEMMQFIVVDILKSEFNIQPKDIEVIPQ